MSSFRAVPKRLTRILPSSSIRTFSSRHTSPFAPRHLLSIADLSSVELTALVSPSPLPSPQTPLSLLLNHHYHLFTFQTSRSAMPLPTSKPSNPGHSRYPYTIPSPAAQSP
jgi:hypothetical protein